MHFRKPGVYEGRVVLLLGAFLSGLDISVDLAPFVKKVVNYMQLLKIHVYTV